MYLLDKLDLKLLKGISIMITFTIKMSGKNFSPESVVVSFDIINMFPCIDNKMSINYVIKFLDKRACKDPPTQCVIDALELCLTCNNPEFNNTNCI